MQLRFASPLLVLLFCWTGLITLAESSEDQPCQICLKGNVRFHNKTVSIPGLPGSFTCGQLETLVPLLLPESTSEECQLLQSVGSICGCDQLKTCDSVCEDTASSPSGLIADKELPFLADVFGGYTPTCELVGAYLGSRFDKEQFECRLSRDLLGRHCGCHEALREFEEVVSSGDASAALPCTSCRDGSDITKSEVVFTDLFGPGGTCGFFDNLFRSLMFQSDRICQNMQRFGTICGCPKADDACDLCSNGEPVPLPEKELPAFAVSLKGLTPTCRLIDSYVHSYPKTAAECQLLQQTGSICGCDTVEPGPNRCNICPGSALSDEDKSRIVPLEYMEFLGFEAMVKERSKISCEALLLYADHLEEGDPNCWAMRSAATTCGCDDGVFSYAAATTDAEKHRLVMCACISAILSLFGVICIIVDVLRDPKKRTNMYNQLILSMSLLDLIYSVAWIVGPAAFPADDVWHFLGEKNGTETTCKIQGFFISLGLASIYFNISLSIYYWLVICRRASKTWLKKMKWILHSGPFTVGIVFAFLGLPYYSSLGAVGGAVVCHIPPAPYVSVAWPGTFLFLVPGWSAIIISTIFTTLVTLNIRRTARTGARWNFDTILAMRSSRRRQQQRSSEECSHVRTSVTRRLSSSLEMVLQQIKPKKKKKRKRGSKVEQEVTFQAILYLSALYLSWIILAVGHSRLALMGSPESSYGYYIAQAILAPLQGFLNFIVYFRPRVSRWLRGRMEKYKKAKEARAGDRTRFGENPPPASSGEGGAVCDGYASGTDEMDALEDMEQPSS